MDKSFYIFCAVVFVMFLLYCMEDPPRQSAYESYESSCGLNDKKSRSAKKKLSKIKDKVAKDSFITTKIKHYNEHNDQFVDKDVVVGYADTLKKIAEEPTTQENIQDHEAMVDNIDNIMQEFADNMMVDPLLGLVLPLDDFDVMEMGPIIQFTETVAPIARQQTTKVKKQIAKTQTKNKKEQVKKYLELSETHTNDPQNTHDPHVNIDVKKTYDLLKNDDMNFTKAYEEAKSHINKSDLGNDKKARAMKTLDHINRNPRSVTTLGGNEKNVFSRVWGRSTSPGNDTDIMRDAVVDALVDSTEHGYVVCPNGVTSRLLESPVTIDKDPNVGKINTFEQIKNMIFGKAHLLIDNEIKQAKKSTNPKIKNIGMSYENPATEVDDEAMDQFEQDLKNKLDDLLTIETKDNSLSVRNMETLREQLHAAI